MIWDVTAVAWLLNDDDRFMYSRIVKAYLPGYDNFYEVDDNGIDMCYVYSVRRDALWQDVISKITSK